MYRLEVNVMSPEATIRLNVLRSAPLDRWIALSEDESRIIAVGKSFTEVSDKSDDSAIILKTPSAWEPFSVSAL
jgi:hypothetical protein